MPRISIILPTYNRAKFIAEAIQSVLDQSFGDFELIIVDDGSEDVTIEKVERFNDSRISLIKKDKNEGRSRARNTGLKVSKGEYIAFLDSDDLYLPDKLHKQVEFLDSHPDVGMIYTSSKCIKEDGSPFDAEYIAEKSGQIYEHIAFFKPVTITLPTVVVRKHIMDKVGGFDVALDRFEDTDMWRRIAKSTYIHAMNEYTCLIRTHPENSLSSQNPDVIVSNLNIYREKILREDQEFGLRFLKRRLALLFYHYVRGFVTIPEWRRQTQELKTIAIKDWPWVKLLFWAIDIKETTKKTLGRKTKWDK